MTDRPRLKDVARSAGVGAMTVSRVLNGGPVGSETMARVHDAMRRLNYHPDQLARSLRTRRTHTLGLIVPRLSDPFFAAITDSVSRIATRAGFALLIATTYSDSDLELKIVREMLSRRVDGLLFVPSENFPAGLIARETGEVKIVSIDQPVRGSRFDFVCANNFEGASSAVNHLISHGHLRIACISTSDSQHSLRERQEGYSSAIAEHGLTRFVVSPFAEGNSTAMMRFLLNGRDAPSAIFTTSWCGTIHVLNALRKLQIRIPDDIAVISFDDFDSANLLSVPLSALRQPATEMGRAATERIIEHVQSKPNDSAPQVLMFSAELILRQSCGCKPGRS